MYNNELAHHGTKGMKWGIRNYQNKDGSLTPAGKKRYGSLEDAVGAVKAYHIKAKRKRNLKKAREAAAAKRVADAEAKAKAEQRAKDVADGKISARKMTSEELQSRIDKLNLEKRYKQLMEETDPSSQVQSFGKTFVKKMWNEAVQPAAAEAGKAVLKDVLIKQLRKKTGLDVDDKSLDALNKKWKELDLKKKISDAEKGIYDNDRHMKGEEDVKTPNIEERTKIKNNPDLLSEKEKEAYKKQGWYNFDKKWEGQKVVDEYNDRGHTQDSVQSTTYSKTGDDIIDRQYRTDKPLSNPPAVVKSAVTSVANVNVNSKDYADKTYKGEKAAFDVIDTVSGETIASFDENGKRKRR